MLSNIELLSIEVDYVKVSFNKATRVFIIEARKEDNDVVSREVKALTFELEDAAVINILDEEARNILNDWKRNA